MSYMKQNEVNNEGEVKANNKSIWEIAVNSAHAVKMLIRPAMECSCELKANFTETNSLKYGQ